MSCGVGQTDKIKGYINSRDPNKTVKLRRFDFQLAVTSLLWSVLWATCCDRCTAQQEEPAQTRKQHSILELQTPEKRPASRPEPVPPSTENKAEQVDEEILSDEALGNMNQLVTRLALDAMPHTYSNDKKWGGQEKRWDGVRLRRDDEGRLKTKRKWKMVNHGTWKKYSATLVEPEDNFSIKVENLHRAEDEKLGFDILFLADIEFEARQAKWAKGVQLYSVNAEGHGRIQLRVTCEMAVNLDFDDFPPDLIFEPVATSAEITVEDFTIDRVSKLGGEFAQQLTRAARRVLDEKIAEKESDIVEKINDEIEEEGELRLRVGDTENQEWAAEAMQFLPGPVQQAFGKEEN